MKKRMFLMVPALLALTAVTHAAGSNVGEMLATRGLFLTLAAVFLGGVMVSLTPCLYPMIPITLSIIGARGVGQKPLTGFLRSLVFVLGIAIVYSALGFFVARTGGTIGFLLQNKWFVLSMAAFFVAMGLAMMDFFTIQMPASISGRLQSGANRGGYGGAFLLGLVTGVVASPCGSPVLAGVLVVAAQSGSGAIGLALLFAYAMGIGLLFLLLGTFPAFLGRVPRSGLWMEDVKKLLGLVMIGVAIYYVRPIMQDGLFWVLVAMTGAATGLLLLVKAKERKAFRSLLWSWRTVGVLSLAIGLYAGFVRTPEAFGAAPMGVAMAVPADGVKGSGETSGTLTSAGDGQTSGIASATAKDGLVWLTSEAEGLRVARETGKPMMIDFMAEWCAACKQLDKETFTSPQVQSALIADFVLVKIDCTEENAENSALQKKYKSMSLPTVAFTTPDGKILDNLTLYEFEKPEKFLERLDQVRTQK